MLERAWASHVHSCKAPKSSEMVTNPGLLSGGENGRYKHSRKVIPVRGGGKKKPEKEGSPIVASASKNTKHSVSNSVAHRHMCSHTHVCVCVRGMDSCY